MSNTPSTGNSDPRLSSAGQPGESVWARAHRLLSGVSGTVAIVATALVLLLHFLAFFVFDHGAYNYAAWVEDDFFYYTVVAQNIVDVGRSTYDGVTLTNGYHPLWMIVCVALGAMFNAYSSAFFLAIFLLQSALVLWGVAALSSLLKTVGDQGLLSKGAIIAATGVYGVTGALGAARGMEIALLWPLMPLLLSALWRLHDQPTLGRALIATTLFSVTALARLDSAVVFGPVCLAVVTSLVVRKGVGPVLRLFPAVLGFLPLLAYLALNIAIFGEAAPISGQAKRLMIDGAAFGPSMSALSSFVDVLNPNFYFLPIGVGVLALAGIGAVAAIPRMRTSRAGIGFLAIGLGCFAFYAQTVFTSDWRMWIWYFYPLCLAGALAAGVLSDLATGLATRQKTHVETAKLWVGVGLAILVTAAAIRVNVYQLRKPPTETNALFARALPIAEFVKTHPGRYAMGDGAGSVGFMLKGLVQLEGLVNDRQMIKDIVAQGRIEDSLRRQKVDYYIAALHPGADGCVVQREPLQSGDRVPHMSQKVCEKPQFLDKTQWITTTIYDVRDGLD